MSDSDSSHMSDNEEAVPTVETVYALNQEVEVPNTNGQLFKTVLVEGTGPQPAKGAKVSVHYVGTLASDGSKFDSSRDRDELFEFELGQGRVIKGWDVGVATMKKGEKCILRCLPEYAYGKNGSPPKIPPNSTLNFEVELFEWSKDEDISEKKDKSFMKSILVEGTGYSKPSYESPVTVHVTAIYPDFESSDPTVGRTLFAKNDWTFTVGDEELPIGLEEGIRSMKKGEKAIIRIRPDLVKPNEKWGITEEFLAYIVELITFEEVNSWKFKGMEKVHEATKRKEDGNKYFAQGSFVQAERKYKRCIEFVEYFHGTPEEEEEVKKLKVATYNNLAQVLLNQKKFSDALVQAKKCLDIDGGNVKALFRRSRAHFALDEWDDAKADCNAILHRDPSNADAQRLLTEIAAAIKNHEKKLKSRFGNMFAKLDAMEKADAEKKKPEEPAKAEEPVKTEEQEAAEEAN